jgi:replicative DNA helicase
VTRSNLKPTPYAEDAERSALGSILIDNGVLPDVQDAVSPQDFFIAAHQAIFAAMQRLAAKNTPIDMVTLSADLDARKELENIGGASYLASLTEYVPTAKHAGEYARVVAEKSQRRNMLKVAAEIAALADDESTDIDDARDSAEGRIAGLKAGSQKFGMNRLSSVLGEQMDQLAASVESQEPRPSLLTGIGALDQHFGGFYGSELITVAARPSMGKSALVMTMAKNMAANGKRVAVFSLEMGKGELANRLLSGASGVDSHNLRMAKVTQGEYDRAAEATSSMQDYEIWINDDTMVSVGSVRHQARRMKLFGGLDCVIIDYLQLMAGDARKSTVDRVSEITSALKRLARELDVPIIMLSQLNRAVESRDSKIPSLSDLRDSGSIEQDSDIVMFMYRDDYYNEASTRVGEVDIHIKKYRNGQTGKVTLRFDKRTTMFTDPHQGFQIRPAA